MRPRKRPENISLQAAIYLIGSLQSMFYMDLDPDKGTATWVTDKEVNGGDLVEFVGEWLENRELNPTDPED